MVQIFSASCFAVGVARRNCGTFPVRLQRTHHIWLTFLLLHLAGECSGALCQCTWTAVLMLSSFSLFAGGLQVLPYWFTTRLISPNSMWHRCPASLLLHLSHNDDMILYFCSLKWHINTSINNSNGTTSPRWQLDDGGEDEGECRGFKPCQQLSKRALPLCPFLLLTLALLLPHC